MQAAVTAAVPLKESWVVAIHALHAKRQGWGPMERSEPALLRQVGENWEQPGAH